MNQSLILHDMEPVLARMLNTTAKVTGIPILLVDEVGARLVYKGGNWEVLMREVDSSSRITQMTLSTGKTQILKRKGTHSACQDCARRKDCPEEASIYVPIKGKEKVIGVIGLICETPEQRNHMLHNFQSYIDFANQLGEWLSFEIEKKAESQRQQDLLSLLHLMLGKMDTGVMILDHQSRLADLNRQGEKYLSAGKAELQDLPVEMEKTGSQYNGKDEYQVVIAGNDKYYLTGDVYALAVGQYEKVFLFHTSRREKNRQCRLQEFRNTLAETGASKSLIELVQKAAKTNAPILIDGEGGLDKAWYARIIHDLGPHKDTIFRQIDCMESSGADVEKMLQTGNARGTLFLSEIQYMSLEAQNKLTHYMLQRKRSSGKMADLRIICSASEDLPQRITEGNFLQELYYLICVFKITIPPLRERTESLRLQAMYYINQQKAELRKPIRSIEETFWKALESYEWPGNNRELESSIEYAVNMMGEDGILHAGLLPVRVSARLDIPLKEPQTLEEMEKQQIRYALAYYKSRNLNREQIAEKLGIGVATLFRKIKKYHLDEPGEG